MIDSSHGTMSFSRERRDEHGVPVEPKDEGPRVVITWPIPGYIVRQMQASEPRPRPEDYPSHPVNRPNAKTISRRTAVQFNGEWWDPGELVEKLADNVVHQDPMEVRSDALPDGRVVGNVRDVYGAVRDRDD